MSLVWIENTQPRLFHLPPKVRKILDPVTSTCVAMEGLGTSRPVAPSVPKTSEGKADLKAKKILTAIDEEYWNFAAQNEQVKLWVKRGWLKIHEADSPDVDKTPTLEPYNEKTALNMVSVESNPDLLTAWLDAEKRDNVIEAIRARAVVVSKQKAAAQPQSKKGQ